MMVSNKSQVKPLIDQFKSFTTFDFICNASSLLEKIFWAVIAVGGTWWIGNIVILTLNHWNEQIFLTSKSNKELSGLTAPAVSFCSKEMSEYTLLERLGNYLDPNSLNLPEAAFVIRSEALKKYLTEVQYDINCGKMYVVGWVSSKTENIGNYQKKCCGTDESCKVNLTLEYWH